MKKLTLWYSQPHGDYHREEDFKCKGKNSFRTIVFPVNAVD